MCCGPQLNIYINQVASIKRLQLYWLRGGGGPTGAAVDMQSAVISETTLVVKPVSTIAARLAQLLDEWPDHPILLQLQAICQRLLGACHHAAMASHRARPLALQVSIALTVEHLDACSGGVQVPWMIAWKHG